MNDWLQHHLGMGPDQRFYEWDLQLNCPDFEALRTQSLLTRDLEAEKSDFLITRWGQCLDLVRIGGSIFGVDTDDHEDPYLEVNSRELIQYRFNWDPYLRKVHEVNRLNGVPSWLHPQLAFLGEKIDAGRKLGFVLGFFNHQNVAMDLLLSLPARLPSGYDIVVVTTLSFDQLPQQDIANLERLRVYVVPPINRETLEIDTSNVTLRAWPPELVSPCSKQGMQQTTTTALTSLTAEQERDYHLYGYNCRLPVHITGKTTKSGNNEVFIGDTPVEVGDVPFLLFLRLVVELRRNKMGTVSKVTLKNDGYLSADAEYQSIQRLRECFIRALGDLDTKDFIQRYHQKTLRISVHPDLVTSDTQRLFSHDDARVRELTAQLFQTAKANSSLTS